MVLAGSPPGSGEILMFAISNSRRTPASRRHPENRFYRSNTLRVQLSGSRYLYKAVGVPVSPQAEQRCENQLAHIHARFGVDHAARRMVAIQRQIRDAGVQQYRVSTVGRSAMVVSLPAVTDTSPAFTFITTNPLSGAIKDGLPTYSFIRDYGFSATRFGPHFVCGDGVGFDLQSGLTPPSASGPPRQWSSVRSADTAARPTELKPIFPQYVARTRTANYVAAQCYSRAAKFHHTDRARHSVGPHSLYAILAWMKRSCVP
jgi:hypothetical protein